MITILDVAMARGAKTDDDGGINLEEFEKLGLPMFGGCVGCGESLAAYNAYPTTSGYIACRECSHKSGFETVQAFEGVSVVEAPVKVSNPSIRDRVNPLDWDRLKRFETDKARLKYIESSQIWYELGFDSAMDCLNCILFYL